MNRHTRNLHIRLTWRSKQPAPIVTCLSDAWNQRMDAYGARRGTWDEVTHILCLAPGNLATIDGRINLANGGRNSPRSTGKETNP
jgi:hypothetical protein